MTPRTEVACPFIHLGFPGDLGHKKLRNEVAYLPQENSALTALEWLVFIHPCCVAGLNKLFQHFFQESCGMAVKNILKYQLRDMEILVAKKYRKNVFAQQRPKQHNPN
jgi:hypothetical protein